MKYALIKVERGGPKHAPEFFNTVQEAKDGAVEMLLSTLPGNSV